MSDSSASNVDNVIKEKRVSFQEEVERGDVDEDNYADYPGRLFDAAANPELFGRYDDEDYGDDESNGEASTFAQEGIDDHTSRLPLEPTMVPSDDPDPADGAVSISKRPLVARSAGGANSSTRRPRSLFSMMLIAFLVTCAGAGITCGLYFGINASQSKNNPSASDEVSPDSPAPPVDPAAPNMAPPNKPTTSTFAPAGSNDKKPTPTTPTSFSAPTLMPTIAPIFTTITPTTPAPTSAPPTGSPAPTRLPYIPGDTCGWNATWSLLGRFRGPDAPGALSGAAVVLSADGQRLAISTPNDDTAVPINSGTVRIYDHYNKKRWLLKGTIAGENVNDASGQSLSFSYDGTLIAIGSPMHSSNNYTNVGQVRVFRYAKNMTTTNTSSSSWTQVGSTLLDPTARPDKSFGTSVALSGDGSIIACGSGGSSSSSGSNSVTAGSPLTTTSSSVSVFQYNGVDWKLSGKVIEQVGGGAPVALSYDGFTLAVGAPSYNATGAVFLYEYNVTESKWMPLGNTLVGNEQEGQFGYGLDLSADGRTVAVGAYQSNSRVKGSGRVQVFQLQNATWVQMGTEIVGKRFRQGLGSVVSLSNDGKRVAISSQTQPAIVYRWIDERQDWYQVAQVVRSGVTSIQSEYETLGFAMDLSKDGTVLAIGDPQFQTVGDVRVYQLSNCTINTTRN